ncbi:MAG TPA: aminotransferase class V-fold PLP-dependent enzyme [Polyangiaceae bacterium]
MKPPGRIRSAVRRRTGAVLDWVFDRTRGLPLVRSRIEKNLDEMLAKAPSPVPQTDEIPRFDGLPAEGLGPEMTLELVERLAAREAPRWQDGYVSGAVYHGDPGHVEFMNRVYALASQTNPLHVDVWPSIAKFEAEIVHMTARMLGAPQKASLETERVVGTVTSGGTESILLAMKAYRDRARAEGNRRPEIVAPASAHAAFDKAAELLRMTIVRVPVASDFRADVRAVRRAVTRRTAVIVGSAPGFPHGVVDPIAELSALALERKVGLHVDACLGGFVLPWARKLGYPVPDFDFSLSGVSSMSADTHKYGYAAKGTSVVLYRGVALRRFQYFVSTDWPGGLYFSPTLAGSRPGALVAATWAALVSIGERGYLDATRRVLETARTIRRGIEKIPELAVLGDPLWVIAFGSRSVDIYRVLDAMSSRGWSLNGLQRPPSLHLCVTLRHTEPGVAARFVRDLEASVAEVKTKPASESGLAPVYGLAGSFPVRGAVAELLRRFVDKLYD